MKILTYKFQNGIVITFKITKDPKHPVSKAEWSRKPFQWEQQMILTEYFNKCVPEIWQKIANFIGETIMWVDKDLRILPKTFVPKPPDASDFSSRSAN